MQLSGSQEFNAPRELVWALLDQPDLLKECLPGCTRLEMGGPGVYLGTIEVGIGMLRGIITGQITVHDLEFPEQINFTGSGTSPQGQVSGNGAIVLKDIDGGTSAYFSMSGNVTGTVARLGARLIQPAVRVIVNRFAACLSARIVQSPAQA